MKNYLMMFIATLFTWGMLQAQDPCGTVPTQVEIEYLEETRIERQNALSLRNDEIVRLPIVNHVLRRDDGTGGLTAEQLDVAIETLNDFYAVVNLEFVACEETHFIDSTEWFDFSIPEEQALRGANDVLNVLNIYYFNRVRTADGGGLCGYTNLPPGPDRIMMANGCTISGSTLIHEVGHYLSLYHTHGKSNCGTTDELVDGTDCGSTGDDVCDTPADPNFRFNPNANNCGGNWVDGGCAYTGTFTDANDEQYMPRTNNIMSYARGACKTVFTPGQFERVRFSAINDRNDLFCENVPVSACDEPQNLALGKTATQSSEYFNSIFPAENAVNGNTASADFSHTQSALGQWWTVDLGEVADISAIKIFNRTSCCLDRLSDFYVFVSDTPFTFDSFTTTSSQNGVSAYFFEGAASAVEDFDIDRTGRYVRVQLTGKNYLHLSEVEVLGCPISPPIPVCDAPQNLAPGKVVVQSSVYSGFYPAARAIDGNTAGTSFSHTLFEQSPSWTIDLGEVAEITTMKIFNRTNCCSDRLSDFHVFVSDTPFLFDDLSITLNQNGVSDFHFEGTAGTVTDFDIERTGRYVRVQLTGANYLQLAEVQVFGCSFNSNTDIQTEQISETKLSLYPNPASQQINVELEGLDVSSEQEMSVMIYALDGKQVYQNQVRSTGLLSINIADLPTGQMYFLHLMTEDGSIFREKFLKM